MTLLSRPIRFSMILLACLCAAPAHAADAASTADEPQETVPEKTPEQQQQLDQVLKPELVEPLQVEEVPAPFEHNPDTLFEAPPPAEEIVDPELAASEVRVCGSTLDARYLDRIDRVHDRISSSVCLPSRWFDRFFAKPGMDHDEEAGTFLRIIGSGNWQEDGDDDSDVRVKAKVDLPNMEQRLSLVFRNDDDVSEEGRDMAVARPGSTQDNTFQAALRWASLQREKHDVDFEVGLRSRLKTFARARYRWKTMLPGGNWGFSVADSVYWRDTIGAGNEVRLDFERPLTRRMLLKLSSKAEINEEMHEMEQDFLLTQYAYFYFWLSKRSALEWYSGVRGYTAPETHVDEYRTGLRLRQNIWRKWFFVELEPYVFWPDKYDFRPVHGVVLRLESQFGDY